MNQKKSIILILLLLSCSLTVFIQPTLATTETFGHTGADTNDYTVNARQLVYSNYTLSQTGYVQNITANIKATTGTISVIGAIYDSAGTLKGTTETLSGVDTNLAQRTLTFENEVELSAGVYRLGVMADGGMGWRFSSGGYMAFTLQQATFAAPSTIASSQASQWVGFELTIYATYNTESTNPEPTATPAPTPTPTATPTPTEAPTTKTLGHTGADTSDYSAYARMLVFSNFTLTETAYAQSITANIKAASGVASVYGAIYNSQKQLVGVTQVLTGVDTTLATRTMTFQYEKQLSAGVYYFAVMPNANIGWRFSSASGGYMALMNQQTTFTVPSTLVGNQEWAGYEASIYMTYTTTSSNPEPTAAPTPAPTATPTPLPNYTTITAPCSITQSGNYLLTNSHTGTGNTAEIDIRADNVYINCDYHQLANTGSTLSQTGVINIVLSKNVTIVNAVVTSAGTAAAGLCLATQYSDRIYIYNSTFSGSPYYTIGHHFSNNTVFAYCTLKNSAYGFVAVNGGTAGTYCENVTLTKCAIYNVTSRGIENRGAVNLLAYNNFINCTTPSFSTSNVTAYFNTTAANGGGNYWALPNGNGFSQITADSNDDGFCDSAYTADSYGSYDYLPLSSIPETILINEDPITPIPTTSPSYTTSPTTPEFIITGASNLTLYLRSETYTLNGVTGYGLYTTNSATDTILTSSVTWQQWTTPVYGFRVWIVHNSGNTQELTGGSPTAIIDPINGDITATWTPMETRISSKQDVIAIKIYMQIGTNIWTEQATFVSTPIQSNTILSTEWTFNINATSTWDGSRHTLSLNFGNLSNSYISGISFTSLTHIDTMNVQPFWQYLFEGNLLGWLNAIYLSGFLLEDIVVGVICLLFLGPLYIRTKSLLLICIIWTLLGGFLIAAVPALSGIALIFLILGVAGLFYRLVRPS